jgi:hypothetical protein
MFGTLVTALPSAHEGGEINFSHADQTKIFKTSEVSQFELSNAGWYAVNPQRLMMVC